MRFRLNGTGAADARLEPLGMLVTHSASSSSLPSYLDAGADGGRSLLFRNGAVYYGLGSFWRQGNAGNASGPY